MSISSSLVRSRLVQKPYQLFHKYFLLETEPGNVLANLELGTATNGTLFKLRNHKWTRNEVCHYGFLTTILTFVFLLNPASFLIKIPILLLFIFCLLVPLTSQFFVPALPIFTWLAFFFTCGKIPTSWRPVISVKVLPAIETIFYGDNLSAVLASSQNSFLDILAWLPYGLIHFSFPVILAFLIFIFGPPTSLRSFGFAFGYMNLVGVMAQLLFPAAPPWYKIRHGLEPANYTMSGSPGGLAKIDQLLGFDMYTSAFSNAPVVFGAFPSLHSGCAVMDVLFLSWLFPKYRMVWWGYCTLLWWSTMYLTHHYFIDLIGGAVFSYAVFCYTKYMHLPVVEQSKFCRWSYRDIQTIDLSQTDPLSSNFVGEDEVYESIPLSNYPYVEDQGSLSLSVNDIPTSGLTRSRQPSRSFINTQPSLSPGNLEPMNETMGRSTSSINLPITEESVVVEGETSSMENGSNVASVFDDGHHSSAESSTSLDELESSYNPTLVQDGGRPIKFNKQG